MSRTYNSTSAGVLPTSKSNVFVFASTTFDANATSGPAARAKTKESRILSCRNGGKQEDLKLISKLAVYDTRVKMTN